MEKSETLRGALQTFLPFEGRFLARMAPEDIATLKACIDATAELGVSIVPQYIQKRSVTGKPLVCLDGLRAEIERLASLERARHGVRNLSAWQRYSAAVEEMRVADRALTAEAEAAGLTAWRRVVTTVSYNFISE